MSELKAYTYDDMLDGAADVDVEYYPKSEADKVIADLEESHKKEVEQLLIKIAEQKSEIERLEILCANYRHDCDNLAISNEQVKRAARTLLKKMNHNKYKRCLDKAKWCFTKSNYHFVLARHGENGKENNRRSILYAKWHKRWLELSEKFKPNSTINRKGGTNALQR